MFLVATFLFPPIQNDPPGLTAKSASYHRYRLYENAPVYDRRHIKRLVDRLEKIPHPNSDYGTQGLPNKTWRALSTSAKFTYCMTYGENFSQNCDGMPAFLNEETKIFAYPSAAFGAEEDWSKRQTAFLEKRRGAVVRLIRETIRRDRRVGVNLKKAILLLKATMLIPDVESSFESDRKDLDILSLLSEMMKQASYAPYRKTSVYRKLYGEKDSDYQSFIPDTPATENVILRNAMEFCKHRSG